ncbi:ribonuclease P protein component [Francisellaceae bacterium]|nr:ribonuclease P protein component [Francisellaceae bacterium]
MLFNSLPKELKLSSPLFEFTFKNVKHRVYTQHFTFLIAKPENKTGIGIIVAKKKVRHATQRNVCKRLLRDFYRQKETKDLLQGFTVVVLATSHANKALKEDLWHSLNTFTKSFEKQLSVS